MEKLRNWFAYPEYSGDFIVEQDCHNLDVLHWFLDARPVRAVGMGGRKVRTTMQILDHLTLSYEFPDGIHVNFEANQISPPGFRRVGEEFTGTAGLLETSRVRMVHHKSAKDIETIESKRDITNDAMEAFLGRIQSGDVENVATAIRGEHAVRHPGPDGDLRKSGSHVEDRIRRSLSPWLGPLRVVWLIGIRLIGSGFSGCP